MVGVNKGIISFHVLLFLSSSEVSVVFNISSSYANDILSNRRFSHEQFLISKYFPISYALLHSKSHVLGFYI